MNTKLNAITIAAAFAASSIAAVPSFAQMGKGKESAPPPAAAPAPASPDKAGSSAITRLDTNRDGFVSREEAKASSDVSARFKQLDKNNDGKLSPEELAAASNPAPARDSGQTRRN